jgi:Flp pilus assembly protein TadG
MAGIRRGRSIRDDSGAETVEFALLSIPLLAVIYGLIAFGLLLNQQITATQLAREAARSAAICANTSGASTSACNSTGASRFTQRKPAGFSGSVSVDSSGCFASPATDATATVSVDPLLPVPVLTTIRGVSSTPCGG